MPRKHAFGWAGPEPKDSRDMPYSVSRAVLLTLPESVDLRGRFVTPAFDQGSIGSCGPQTAAADLLFDQEQNPALDVMPSRLFIYWAARKIMGTINSDSGVYNRDLCKALAQYGWPAETTWPYVVSKFRDMPPETAFIEAVARKVTRYAKVAQTLSQMQGALAQNDPFIFGFNWYTSWSSAAVNRSGDLPEPRASDRVEGGHDVLIVGYSNASQRFLFRNSWGTSWGKAGYGTIPYSVALDSQKASDFWTLHWDDPPPPSPPLPPPEEEWIVRFKGQKPVVELVTRPLTFDGTFARVA